jgi:predicted MFS family arabinose efflux permease
VTETAAPRPPQHEPAARRALLSRRLPRPGRPLAWRRPGFRQLTRAWFCANVADSALYLMLAVWVKELSGSDAAAALVFAALGLPALVSPLLGHVADRVSRRRLLAGSNLALAAVLCTLLLVSSAADLWLVYAVTFLYGCMGYTTSAAQSGLVRDLLDDDELPGGNGLLSTIDQGLRLVSPLLGTALYALAGPKAVVVLTATCAVATAVQLVRLQVSETPPSATHERQRYLTEVVAGFRHIARTPVLGPLTIAIAVGFGATGMANVAVFPAMEQGLGVDPAMLGALVSLQGVGALVGGATSAGMIHRLGEQATVALGMLGLATGMAALVTTSLAVVVAGLVLVGGSVTWVVVAFVTLRQRLTPPRLQGRTAAATNVSFNLPQTLVTFGAAAVIAVLDYRIVIAATVVGVVAAAALAAPRPGRGRFSGSAR